MKKERNFYCRKINQFSLIFPRNVMKRKSFPNFFIAAPQWIVKRALPEKRQPLRKSLSKRNFIYETRKTNFVGIGETLSLDRLTRSKHPTNEMSTTPEESTKFERSKGTESPTPARLAKYSESNEKSSTDMSTGGAELSKKILEVVKSSKFWISLAESKTKSPSKENTSTRKGKSNENNSVSTECFIDLGKLNLLIISLPWSKSVKQTV